MAPSPLMPVEEALAAIIAGVEPLPPETVALDDAWERTLAEDLAAGRDQPPFNASAMDGYAVHGDDVDGTQPVLKVVGQSAAGRAYTGPVKRGEAVRIFTGAPVPDDCDTVVIQENTVRDGDLIRLTTPGTRGRHIRRRGVDFAAGQVLIAAGTRLNARHIGVAAAANQAQLKVRRKPLVAILPTGDELVAPGEVPRADQIISSNNHALAAFVRRMGGEPVDLGIVADRMEALDKAIARGLDADILVTIGGASVGDHDLIQAALKARGLDLAFWKIAMRPGKPMMFGRLGATRVVGLPGNPVSAQVCARIFLKPLIDRLLGRNAEDDQPDLLPVATALGANDQRQDYLRAQIIRDAEKGAMVAPQSLQDSSLQHNFAKADCLIIRPPHAPEAEPGTPVPILRLDF